MLLCVEKDTWQRGAASPPFSQNMLVKMPR